MDGYGQKYRIFHGRRIRNDRGFENDPILSPKEKKKNSLQLTHLRINDVVHQSIDSIFLIVSNDAHSLFTHSALIRIPWTLIVMWIRYQTL